ncbi:hypothetical protein TrLO_g879 [Triparma laevis f. longispina]|uniref:Phytol kinase n=1 Tax=Triparma laevis f. longispina TaxID=1714387 RepID=A0A9W7DLQ4_9STRA|nr:hypothetical protein TrLO_g879 [Triparma laevis f. longispina]
MYSPPILPLLLSLLLSIKPTATHSFVSLHASKTPSPISNSLHFRGGAQFSPYQSSKHSSTKRSASKNEDDQTSSASLPVRIFRKSLFILAPISVASAVTQLTPSIHSVYHTNQFYTDLGASLGCAVLATVWLKIITTLATNSVIDSKDARKLIHTGSAPLFMFVWPFFSDSPWAALMAGCVPLANLSKIIDAGKSANSNDVEAKELASAVSRTGDATEVLGGPFIYTVVLLIATTFFWRSSVSVIAISQMAAGDGVADLAGRRWGQQKWFFSKDKSYAGSAAFVGAATVTSLALMAWLDLAPVTPNLAATLFGISIVCSFIELLPLGDDNWTVPISGGLLAYFLLQ